MRREYGFNLYIDIWVYVCLIGLRAEGLTKPDLLCIKEDLASACGGSDHSRGTIESTNVNLTWKVYSDGKYPTVELKCSSCRVPNGHNVEYLRNNRSVDSITYDTATAKCSHILGECSADICCCNSLVFIRYYKMKDIFPKTHFSCDMRFLDSLKSQKFSMKSTLYFDGQEFYYNNTVTSTTPLEDDFNRNEEDNEVWILIGFISATVIVPTFIFLMCCYYRKKSRKNQYYVLCILAPICGFIIAALCLNKEDAKESKTIVEDEETQAKQPLNVEDSSEQRTRATI